MKQHIHSYVRYKHFMVFLIIIPLIAVISIYLSSTIEKNLSDRVNHVLKGADSSWAEVSIDGLEVIVNGKAPNEVLRKKNIEALKEIVAPSQLVDRTTVENLSQNQKPSFRIFIVKDTKRISVIGVVPNNAYRETIIRGFEDYSDTDTDIRIEISNNEKVAVTESWRNNLKFALLSLSHFLDGTISINQKGVLLSILAPDNNTAERIREAISANAPGRSDLSINVVAPKSLISPYIFEYTIANNEGIIHSCSVETLSDQNSILQKAKKFPLKENPVCITGIGSPSPNWKKAVEEAILLLQSIGEGELSISDLQISVLVKEKNTKTLKLTQEFKKNLPKEFNISLKFEEISTKNNLKNHTPFGIRIEKDKSNKIKISGQLRTNLERQVIDSYTKVFFSNQPVELHIDLNETLPTNLVGNTAIGMEALRNLYSGILIVEQKKLQLVGKTVSLEGPAEIESFLRKMLNSQITIKTDIMYDKSLSPTIIPMTPEECVTDINKILEKEKIVFEPASTAIRGSSRLSIKKIAMVIKKCEHIKMEISGHTDSQGREEMNLNLSQLRADAVKSALLSRRVKVKNLISKGYGERFPIADNKTEEGREINRRIEFKLIKNSESKEIASESNEMRNND